MSYNMTFVLVFDRGSMRGDAHATSAALAIGRAQSIGSLYARRQPVSAHHFLTIIDGPINSTHCDTKLIDSY